MNFSVGCEEVENSLAPSFRRMHPKIYRIYARTKLRLFRSQVNQNLSLAGVYDLPPSSDFKGQNTHMISQVRRSSLWVTRAALTLSVLGLMFGADSRYSWHNRIAEIYLHRIDCCSTSSPKMS